MVRMLRFKILLGLLGIALLYPVSANANAVIDVYNYYNRQLVKNERVGEHANAMRKSDPSLPKGSEDIAKYIGLEYEYTSEGVKGKFNTNSDYKCDSMGSFDGAGGNYSCRDWAADITKDNKVLKNSDEHFQDIQKIIGDSLPLDGKDENHLSVAVQFMGCLAGTANKNTVAEYNEVSYCKELVDWTETVLMLKDLADLEILEYMYAPAKQFFVVKEETRKKMYQRPTSAAKPQDNLNKVDEFVRNKMTDNVCERQLASKAGLVDQTSTARRLALAQGYATAISSRRTAELFSKYAVSYLHEMVKSDGSMGEYNPKTIRQDLHLLLAADAGIIYLLGQINGLQGVISELNVLDNDLGGISSYNGVTHLVGEFKTTEELCAK